MHTILLDCTLDAFTILSYLLQRALEYLRTPSSVVSLIVYFSVSLEFPIPRRKPQISHICSEESGPSSKSYVGILLIQTAGDIRLSVLLRNAREAPDR